MCWNGRYGGAATIVNIEDLRIRAHRRLPRAVFDYIDGAAEDEVTARENRAAFERLQLRPRVLVNVDRIDQSTSLFGQRLDCPIILAPTGLCGMAAVRGELLAARAATRAGTLFTLATLSAVSIEDLMRQVPGPHWFQLYVYRDKTLTNSLVERAQAAGYKALVVTVDVPVLGMRERDKRNGAQIPPRLTLRNALDSTRHLPWLLHTLRDPWIDFVNLRDERTTASRRAFALSSYINAEFDPAFDWEGLAAIRRRWTGPLLLKGVMSGEDARRAVESGVDGIVVSNHGGRQLDGLPATLDVLPEVVEAIAAKAEVILDGGIRRGSDIVKAVALGARACMIGRPYLYGLGAGGRLGAELAIRILRADIARTLALLGRPSLDKVDRSVLR
jgi:L-lactate dehydrogenase (cytochrome)